MNYIKRFRTLTESSHRWKLYLVAGIMTYYIIINTFITLRPDHVFLTLFLFTFLLGGNKAKRFLIDWLPFIGFWILYDMMRGIADDWRGYVYIREVYDAEVALFGRFFQGSVPAFWFQQLQQAYDSHTWKQVFDIIAANLYSSHFFSPLILGWILWHTHDDRRMFYRFVWTLTILNAMALITFFLYPAAPPHYVLRFGFIQPSGRIFGLEGGLINIDRMIEMKFFTTIWNNMNPNAFAAIPSLHGAYPLVISLFAWIKFRKYPLFFIIFPLLVWWATVYLNHHYIIDLIIGSVYAGVAYAVNHYIVMPRFFDPLLFRKDRPDRR